MGSPVDLTLGCSTQALPSSNGSHSLRPGSSYPGDYLESFREAEEYLGSLEDERRKVEGFKRELPLCIQLLENAIQTSKEKVASGKKEQQLTRSSMDSENEYSRPRLEEFLPLNMNLPLKRRWDADAENEGGSDGETEGTWDRGSKRPAWMAEAQVWTQTSVSSDQTRHEKEKETEQLQQEQSSVTSCQQQQQQQQLLLTSKERPTGAFLPFLREQPGTSAGSPLTVARPVPRTAGSGAGLSLSFGEPLASPCTTLKTADSEVTSIDAAVGLQTPEAGNNHQEGVAMAAGAGGCNGVSGAGSSSGGQSNRKARRCWSPELHRRFVSALHQLGGCQIATPKQIRELMKVDGLTNDEVKSHLQKYRLHTRRPSPSPQAAGGAQPPPQLVVLGGIWVPPKYTASGSSQPGSSQPGSSGVYDPTQHPPQFLPPDGSYFACISNGASGAPVQVHHHRQPIFEPQQAGSQSQCSPQGPLQVTSQLSGATQGPSGEVYHDESGEEEEAKSDSRSWKISPERDGSDIRSSSSKPTATTTSSELPNSNLNLQVACSTVQSNGVTTASEEEVNQQQQAQ